MKSQSKKILIIAILLFVPLLANAQEVQGGFLDELACVQTGDCGFADIALGFSSLIRLLLGGMGAVALVYFVYGGIQWLISGGNADRVERGKQIMINTIFALFIAFGSYIIVSFFINDVLNVKNEYNVSSGVDVNDCTGRAMWTPCGQEGEDNVCTGRFNEYLIDVCYPRAQLEHLIATGEGQL